MTEEAPTDKLPAPVRRRAVGCLLLSGAVGFWSASEALGLIHFSDLKESRRVSVSSLGTSAAMEKGLFRALEPIHAVRVLTLGALAIACSLTLVCAGRLLYPAGLPREGMRRLLAHSTLVAALLRTIDGAQGTVVARKVATAMAKEPPFTAAGTTDSFQSFMPSLAAAVTIGVTGLVVVSFTLMSQYFRSTRVKEALAAMERQQV